MLTKAHAFCMSILKLVATFGNKNNFISTGTEISKSWILKDSYRQKLLFDSYYEFFTKITPCTYNIVQNINKIIHSELVFVFLKNLLNWIFILLIILLIFRVERSGDFFICSDLEVCLLDRGDWLFLWRTLTVYNSDFDSTVFQMWQYLIKY